VTTPAAERAIAFASVRAADLAMLAGRTENLIRQHQAESEDS
jgi:hypothetical protein